jgi:hypothetical protein
LRRWQTWIWIAGIASAMYLAYLLISGLLTPAAPTTATDSEMVMRGIVSRGQHGDSGWRFVADSSEISPDGYTTTYHGVRDATFLRSGKPVYRLTAGIVTVDARNENYSASGDVHVWSNSPTLPDDLQTEDAYWDQAGQTLTCPTQTRFVYHGTVMRTTHMTVDLDSGASQLGDTSIDYFKAPAPRVSATPSPARSSANR